MSKRVRVNPMCRLWRVRYVAMRNYGPVEVDNVLTWGTYQALRKMRGVKILSIEEV